MLATNLKFASQSRHIWWGVSVEDRKYGLPRVKHLQASPAVVKFLSIEPLLADIGDFDISGIDWAIVGGESGYGARPMEAAWVERILRLCRSENVHFFFKQWGGIHKSTAGRVLHGRTYDEMPTVWVEVMPEKKIRQARALFWNNRASRYLSSQPNDFIPLGAVAG